LKTILNGLMFLDSNLIILKINHLIAYRFQNLNWNDYPS